MNTEGNGSVTQENTAAAQLSPSSSFFTSSLSSSTDRPSVQNTLIQTEGTRESGGPSQDTLTSNTVGSRSLPEGQPNTNTATNTNRKDIGIVPGKVTSTTANSQSSSVSSLQSPLPTTGTVIGLGQTNSVDTYINTNTGQNTYTNGGSSAPSSSSALANPPLGAEGTTLTNIGSNTNTQTGNSSPTISPSTAGNTGTSANIINTPQTATENGGQINEQLTTSLSAISTTTAGLPSVTTDRIDAQGTPTTGIGAGSSAINNNESGVSLPADSDSTKPFDTKIQAQSSLSASPSNSYDGNTGSSFQSITNSGTSGGPSISPAGSNTSPATAGSTTANPSVPLYDQLTSALQTKASSTNQRSPTDGIPPLTTTFAGGVTLIPQATNSADQSENSISQGTGNSLNGLGQIASTFTSEADNLQTPITSGIGNSVTPTNSNGAPMSIQTGQTTTDQNSTGLIPSSQGSQIGLSGGVVPASISSNGRLISNPAATATATATAPAQTSIDPVSITSDGQLVLNPALTATGQVSSEAASFTLSGQVISNPAATATAAGQDSETPASTSFPNSSAGFVPAVTAAQTGGSSDQSRTIAGGAPASSTFSNGEVIPVSRPSNTFESSNPTKQLSATLSNGAVLPLSSQTEYTRPSDIVSNAPAEQSHVVGSSTLSNGQVVPVTSSLSPATEKSGILTSDSSSPAFPTLSSVLSSTTLSNGQVVPIAPSSSATGSITAESQSLNSQGPESATSWVSGSPTTQGSTGGTGAGASQSTDSASAAQPNNAAAIVGEESYSTSPPTAGLVVTTPQVFPTNSKGPFTQQPTGYDQSTTQPVLSSITSYPSSSPPPGSLPTGLPSGVPLVLYPPTGAVEQPKNTELIRIGFKYPLNYDFVRSNDDSKKQIFTFLPRCISYGLEIGTENVTMQALRAWDTTQDLHYVTTLALAWIPSSLVDALAVKIRTPPDKLFNHPNPSVKTLSGMINTAITIRADNETSGGSPTVNNSPSDSASSSGAAPIGGNIGNTSPVKASSIGIGVGIVCGAAAYGAAMFFVARRYKKRRQSHMRSPSMYSSPVVSHAGPDPAAGAALMSGAMGGERSVSPFYDRADSRGSGRSGASSGRQQISAPVMAENSLGWN